MAIKYEKHEQEWGRDHLRIHLNTILGFLNEGTDEQIIRALLRTGFIKFLKLPDICPFFEQCRDKALEEINYDD